MKYYKVTNSSEEHRDMKYKNGLNVLKKKINCTSGIYFADKNHIHNWLYFGKWIREITIPNGTKIKKRGTSQAGILYSDKVIMGKRLPIYNMETQRKIGFKFVPHFYEKVCTRDKKKIVNMMMETKNKPDKHYLSQWKCVLKIDDIIRLHKKYKLWK